MWSDNLTTQDLLGYQAHAHLFDGLVIVALSCNDYYEIYLMNDQESEPVLRPLKIKNRNHYKLAVSTENR